MENIDFYSNLGSSILGNIFLVCAVGVAWCVRNKCSHSKSKCKSPCCEFEAQEDSIEIQKKKTESKENLLELLREMKIIPQLAQDSPRTAGDVVGSLV